MTGIGDDDVAPAAVSLPVLPPFHLEGTVRVLQRRPANRVERWEQHRYQRVLATAEGLRLVAVENLGTVEEPDLRCHPAGGPVSSHTQATVSSALRRLLGLDVDPAPFYTLAGLHPGMRPAVAALRGVRPPRFPSLLEAFANVIPFQQVSLAAGVSIVGRIVLRFGERLALGGQVYYAFPDPEALAYADPDELRSLGLSHAKAGTLQAVARHILAGELSEQKLEALSSEAALQALTTLPGIGPWSAGLVLLRGLGRMDVFPPGDVGAQHNLARLLAIDPSTARANLPVAIEQMGSMRGFLYFYALGWRLLQEELITPAIDPAERPSRS